jgi:hypothetical protein
MTARDVMLQHSIIPPDDLDQGPLKKTRVVIDSSDRDMKSYPTSTQYIVNLPDEINEVVSIELTSAWFPFSAYNVNSNNNTFVYSVDHADHTITIPPGNYTETTLATAFNSNNNSNNSNFSVAYIPQTDNFKIINTNSNNLQINFGSNQGTCSRLLGFSGKTYSINSNVSSITSDFRRDFDYYNTYVVLNIDAFDSLISTNNSINRCFAMIYKHKIEAGLDSSAQKTLNPPMQKLQRFSVKVQDRLGNEYDANNQDHVFELIISHYQNSRKNW